MNKVKKKIHHFQLVGGELCLDFANTVGGTRRGVSREYLKSYSDLMSWCQQVGVLPQNQFQALTREASRRPGEAKKVLRRALALRETVYRMFSALIENKPFSCGDLDLLNEELCIALRHARIVKEKSEFVWDWAPNAGELDQLIWPVARSAGHLLTAKETLAYLRECASDTCGWLFVDTSKNHSRRWCDMRDCGTRAKVRRHRQKKKKQVSRGNFNKGS